MGNNKNKTKSHLSKGKYKKVNLPLWWSNSAAQSKEFVIMSLRFCTKIITLIVLHFCGIKLFTPYYYSHCSIEYTGFENRSYVFWRKNEWNFGLTAVIYTGTAQSLNGLARDLLAVPLPKLSFAFLQWFIPVM